MTMIGTPVDFDELVPGPETTYDLIICRADRIVFHYFYASPAYRLRMCAELLISSDVVADVIDAARANEIHELYQSHTAQWDSEPDAVVNVIAKLCRRWGVQIYVSTTRKKSAAPATLYSVITEYGPGQTIAEHFPSRAARRQSLIERADTFFRAPGSIPEVVLVDDQRLAALVATLLMPASVTLTEAALDEQEGVYRSSGRPLPVR